MRGAFAPSPFKVQLGVSAAMPVSAGFWDIGLAVYKENNNNGIVGKAVSFTEAPALNTAWAIPMGGVGAFTGFASIVGPKGKDGFGEETKTETLIRASFMFDIGGGKSGLTAGLGVEYWDNKFGCDNSHDRMGVGERVITWLVPLCILNSEPDKPSAIKQISLQA